MGRYNTHTEKKNILDLWLQEPTSEVEITI